MGQFCGSRNCSEKGKAAHGILDVCQCGFDAFMGDLCHAKPILDYETLPLAGIRMLMVWINCGEAARDYCASLSSKGSPHSGQNFGGFFGSSGSQPHLSQR